MQREAVCSQSQDFSPVFQSDFHASQLTSFVPKHVFI